MTAAPLRLQRCATCAALQYPPRELCASCLADTLAYTDTPPFGQVLATTDLHHSHEPNFRAHLPLRVALIHLDAGPTAVCFLGPDCPAGTRVQITASTDPIGRQILTAAPTPAEAQPPAATAAPSG